LAAKLERGTTSRGAAAVRPANLQRAAPAARPQRSDRPRVLSGQGAPSPAFMKAMLNPDGTINPEFERRAQRGEFLGADLARAFERRSRR
jgi:hypothetical protein